MPAERPSIADKRRTFHQMHAAGCFVIPNPWDVGSALMLQNLGFKALATTSSGHAWSCGYADGAVPLIKVIEHLHEMVAATDVPLNADFQNGFAHEPGAVAENVRLAVDAGVAGLSVEDATGDEQTPLYDLDTAVARIRAARAAIDAAGGDTLLVARAECFLVNRPSLDETIARLQAYAQAGADCLYAPGIRSREQITTVVSAVAPKPVNVLIGWAANFPLADIAQLGVRRVSVGGALARSAWGGFMRAASLIAEQGRFDGFADAARGHELDAFFHQQLKGREQPS